MIRLSADIPPQARAWRNDRRVYQWCRQFDLIDEQAHERWLDRISTDPTIRMYGVFDNTTPVGVCGLTSINRVNQSAEFSLYIAPNYHRRGYGKEALKTLLTQGFYAHNLNRIWGECYAGNPALKIFKSLGMKVEGTLRQSYFRDGHFIDSQIVSVLREEFQCSNLSQG